MAHDPTRLLPTIKNIKANNEEFADTKEGKWLAKHCHEFGFIIRYKAEWEDITGYMYEPWHVRYVGVDHARRMRDLDMCLEEYVDYLTKQ